MKLAEDWDIVLKKAWSVRFMILAAIFAALDTAIPYLQGILPVSQTTFSALAGLATGAALFSRFVAQRGVEDRGSSSDE